MSFVNYDSKVKSIRQGEDGFMLDDGFIRYPRAMIHITPECPTNVRTQIEWAIANGYLKSVAHIYKHEETFNLLANNG